MAGEVHCFTSISFSYLDRARVLAETVRRHHPDWTLWLCLSDREPPGLRFDIAEEQFDRVVRVDELGIDDLPGWIFRHDVVELCTAVKGAMLHKLLASGAQKVVYLDPDIALFDSLSPMIDLLDRHTVLLTPHLLAPEPSAKGIIDNEVGSLKHGVYNLGFVAVRNSPEGAAFAGWWRDRLVALCYDDPAMGLFTDQRWCDLVPVFFPGTGILRDPGYNVACWNLSNRPIDIAPDGDILAGGSTLRFFHFTKVSTVGESVLRLYAGGRSEVFELLRWYRERLAAHAVDGLPANYWAYSRYDDGTPIEPRHRVRYRKQSGVAELFPNPFASGPGCYLEWYEKHPDAQQATKSDAGS